MIFQVSVNMIFGFSVKNVAKIRLDTSIGVRAWTLEENNE